MIDNLSEVEYWASENLLGLNPSYKKSLNCSKAGKVFFSLSFILLIFCFYIGYPLPGIMIFVIFLIIGIPLYGVGESNVNVFNNHIKEKIKL